MTSYAKKYVIDTSIDKINEIHVSVFNKYYVVVVGAGSYNYRCSNCFVVHEEKIENNLCLLLPRENLSFLELLM